MLTDVLKRKHTLLFLVAGIAAWWLPLHAVIAEEIKIGLRAHRGAEIGLKKWQPTADYLSQAIPEHHFVMVPFEINS